MCIHPVKQRKPEGRNMPQAPTNLERFRCHFSKSGNIRKHCTITHRFYNLPGRRIQAATVWRVSHKYPLFLRRSLSQMPTGSLSGNLKKPCEKRTFVWFSILRPAAESVPEFLKKSVHSACEMCPAEEGLFVSPMRKQTLPKMACRYAFGRGWRCTGFL